MFTLESGCFEVLLEVLFGQAMGDDVAADVAAHGVLQQHVLPWVQLDRLFMEDHDVRWIMWLT